TPLIARRSIPSITSTTNRARCFSGSHSSTDGGRRNPVWRSIVRKLFIGATFAAMENHRTDSIPNDSYPVKSDRLLVLRPPEPARACPCRRRPANSQAPGGGAVPRSPLPTAPGIPGSTGASLFTIITGAYSAIGRGSYSRAGRQSGSIQRAGIDRGIVQRWGTGQGRNWAKATLEAGRAGRPWGPLRILTHRAGAERSSS